MDVTWYMRLRAARIQRGITQSTIAKALGISARSYQRYEAGDGKPGIDTLVDIADYLDISLDYLMGREKEYISKDTSI